MKVAVYAIAKNEEDNVKGWYESAKGANEIILVDTGSTDNTLQIAYDLGIKTHSIKVTPWRFDRARNIALSCVSEDIDFCLALDLDERLQPNWRVAFDEVNPSTTRIKYQISYLDNGIELMRYWANRCHHRQNYRWEYEIHETPVYKYGEDNQVFQLLDFEVVHEQDQWKERPYTDMLESCANRFPDDLRYAWLYARELLNDKRYEEAYAQFLRYLKMPGSRTDIFLADIYRYMGMTGINPVEDLTRSLSYATRRETFMDLARHYNDMGEWEECLRYCDLAFEITEHPIDFTSFRYAWGVDAYSTASMAAMNLSQYDRGKDYIRKGLTGGVDDEKLLNNLKLIEINEMLSPV